MTMSDQSSDQRADHKKLTDYLWKQAAHRGLPGLAPQTFDQEKLGLTTIQIQSVIPSSDYGLLLLFTDIKESVFNQIAEMPLQQLRKDEKLFDLIMMHFDAAQIHKHAIKHLWSDLQLSPRSLIFITPFLMRYGLFLRQKSEYISKQHSWADYLQEPAFCLLIISVFTTWLQDDTLDQNLTLAALDRCVKQFDRFFS